MLKILTTVFVLVLTLTTLGCGDHGKKNDSGVGPVAPLRHAASECPQIAGDFIKDSTNQKSFRTTPIAGGIHFTDSETEYTIDGSWYTPKGNANLTYAGGCDGKAVVIDVYEGSVYLGRFKYSVIGESQSQKQVQIETTAHDSRLGDDGSELWQSQSK